MTTTNATTTTSSSSLSANQNKSISEAGVANSEAWMTTPAPRIVFLSVFFAFGFFGNLFLIITVCHTRRFRTRAFFIFVINLAVINICECVLNMSILLASSIINEWKFGSMACKASSFFLNLIFIETVLGLTICTADRFVAMRFKEHYDHVISTPRIAILIAITWLQSFAFCVPIAVGSIPTTVNSYIVYCVISKSSSVIYSIFSAFLCFIVPLVLMITFFVNIIRSGYKDRFEIRNVMSQRNYEEDSVEEPKITQEIRNSNLTGTICIIWLVLEGPHIVTSYMKQFQNSSELGHLSTNELRYTWYVDLVLLWLRFSYCMALPIASFVWNKDLWKSFKDIILCRKNNAVVDESFKKGDTDTLRLDRKIREEKLKEKEAIISPREQRVFQVPVLFATSNGVHIQTSSQSDFSDEENDESEKSKCNINGTLRGKKCDVTGSRDNVNNMEDDTSDYDSGNELDPFSVSHPISVKQINNSEFTERKRSNSEPEVREKELHNKSNGRTVGSSSEGDSGLDLSTGTFNKNSRTKGMFHVPCDKIVLHDTQSQLQTELIQTTLFAKPPLQQIAAVQKDNFVGKYAEFPSTEDNKIETCISVNHNARVTELSCENRKTNKESLEKAQENNTENPISTSKTIKNSVIDTTDSPLPRKKKKKRKETSLDAQSISSVTSLSGAPPKPPPRLAPITSMGFVGIQSLYPVTGRPGSGCSSQYSVVDSHLDGRNSVLSCDSFSDMVSLKSEHTDNMSESSVNKKTEKGKKRGRQKLKQNESNNENEVLKLNLKREIKSVPEEVVTPSECFVDASSVNTKQNNGFQKPYYLNGKIYDECSETVKDGAHVQQIEDDVDARCRTRNVTARQKRRDKMSAREKLSTSSLLNESVGYQRLVPEMM